MQLAKGQEAQCRQITGTPRTQTVGAMTFGIGLLVNGVVPITAFLQRRRLSPTPSTRACALAPSFQYCRD